MFNKIALVGGTHGKMRAYLRFKKVHICGDFVTWQFPCHVPPARRKRFIFLVNTTLIER